MSYLVWGKGWKLLTGRIQQDLLTVIPYTNWEGRMLYRLAHKGQMLDITKVTPVVFTKEMGRYERTIKTVAGRTPGARDIGHNGSSAPGRDSPGRKTRSDVGQRRRSVRSQDVSGKGSGSQRD